MRRGSPRPIGLALDRMLESVAPATLLAEVQRVWPEAAGRAFAGAGEPVSEHGGVVRVSCVSAVWAQELDLMSQRVVDAVNERLGRRAVTRLRCEVGRRGN
jgi:predicted nucleic acid-binding Zn ribbon protein